jgi:hypothetical protein
MKAPEGKRPQVAIQADIDRWVKEHFDGAYCRTCGAVVQDAVLYASVHESSFSNSCAGYGDVIRLRLPYCRTCEPGVAEQTHYTCIHEEES